MSTTPQPVVHPGIENKSLFQYTLFARDDDRALYAADDLQHIRYFCSWLADDLYLDLRHADGTEVADGWQFGPYGEPDYADLLAEENAKAIQDAEVIRDFGEIVSRDYSKVDALLFEQSKLNGQRQRAKRAGF